MRIGIGISPVLAGVLGGDAGVGLGVGSDLQRLLALSPSLLIWPANGAGWQGTSGGTLAASGQPLGLGADLSQLQGKTLSEWLAAPTTSELVTNGDFATSTGWTLGSGQTITGGELVFTAVVSGTAALFQNTFTNGKVYRVDIEIKTLSAGSFRVRAGLGALTSVPASVGVHTVFIQAGSDSRGFDILATGASTTGAIDNVSVRELPGNHLRAGTWASPSDAARGTFQNNAISFDGSSDYYSLLNAISITESMTVVRAFKRASAGIRSAGLGEGAGGGNPRDFFWQTTNVQSYSLSGTTKTVSGSSTATGSFVSTVKRNASEEIARLNGTQIDAVTANAVAGSFGRFGDVAGSYNNGEISFLAVFPTELTGANLTLVEQIAAATNGAAVVWFLTGGSWNENGRWFDEEAWT